MSFSWHTTERKLLEKKKSKADRTEKFFLINEISLIYFLESSYFVQVFWFTKRNTYLSSCGCIVWVTIQKHLCCTNASSALKPVQIPENNVNTEHINKFNLEIDKSGKNWLKVSYSLSWYMFCLKPTLQLFIARECIQPITLFYRQLYGQVGKNLAFPNTQKYCGDEVVDMLLYHYWKMHLEPKGV